MTTNIDSRTVTHRFIEALNARDIDALEELIADNAEFFTPEGKVLTGRHGAETLAAAAEDAGVTLADPGEEAVTEDRDAEHGDVVRVVVPLDVIVRGSRLPGTAHFAIRDGRVAEFEVVTQEE
jgi:ketosteroid isomerase-like protein